MTFRRVTERVSMDCVCSLSQAMGNVTKGWDEKTSTLGESLSEVSLFVFSYLSFYGADCSDRTEDSRASGGPAAPPYDEDE